MDEEQLLNNYFREIRDSTPLSREEEASLSRRIRSGDEGALGELVNANYKFVADIAKGYKNKGVSYMDLIMAGNMGLVTAAERFDGSRGFKFISYAVFWIRQQINRTLRQTRNVKRPGNRLTSAVKVSRTVNSLYDELGRYPTEEEIADEIGITAQKVREADLAFQYEVSLDDSYDDDGRNLLDVIPDDRVNFSEEIEEDSLRDYIRRSMRVLNKKEIYVLTNYFGLDGEEPAPLEVIGTRMGLCRERVRQVKNHALDKLKKYYTRVGVAENEILH